MDEAAMYIFLSHLVGCVLIDASMVYHWCTNSASYSVTMNVDENFKLIRGTV